MTANDAGLRALRGARVPGLAFVTGTFRREACRARKELRSCRGGVPSSSVARRAATCRASRLPTRDAPLPPAPEENFLRFAADFTRGGTVSARRATVPPRLCV